MKSFTFQSQQEEELKIERIISERKKKIATQQIIYSSILAIILLGAVYYAYNKLHYEDFDGYVSTEHWMRRAVSDLYIKNCYVDAGDVVFPGDTLYSYVLLDNVLKLYDISNEPSIIAQDRTIRLQSGVNMPDINLLNTRIQELQKQIALENNNIRFGMSDNSHKMDLERELILKQLQAVPEKNGVKEIEALGKPFDPNFHNAVMTEDAEGVESGTVTKVLQKGYVLNSKVIRPAMVGVAN